MSRPASTTSTEENKALMRDYLERFWNQTDIEAGERFIAEDMVLHGIEADVPVALPPGRAGVIEMRRLFEAAMPDFTLTIDDMIAEGDKVLVRWTGEGTHTGNLMGIPATHRRTRWTAMSISRIEDGMMVEGWQNMDNMGMMRRLGVLPSGSPPAPMRWFLTARGRLQARKNRRAGG